MRVYIGRNELHDDEENAIDMKEFVGPVIISQNKMYGYLPSSGSNGDAIRGNDEGVQGDVWILFNDIWGSSLGIEMFSAAAPNIYIIGNEFHDITTGDARAISNSPDLGAAIVRVLYNTFINVTTAIGTGEAKNNIIQATSIAIGASVVGCNSNHVQQGSINVSCVNGASGDPLLTLSGVHVTGLQATSPAIGTALGNHTAFDTFETAFGLDIRKDRNGVSRPQGAQWDKGCYEFVGAAPSGIAESLLLFIS